MNFAAWLGVCSLAIWIYLALFRAGFCRLPHRLKGAASESGRSVTAIIPARDEREFIGRAVASLRRQGAHVRIVVADDESTDGTGEASHADEVVRVQPRPAGWKGKLWAVASALKQDESFPEFFLLTDADIEYVSADVVSALIRQGESGFDLVSVMVRLHCATAAEQMLIPAFVFFFFKLYPPGAPAAAGGCMLIRREMLERIGGMESIHDALIDDCALAARVAACGGKVWLGVSDLEIRSIRPYGGVAGIRAMIARSAFAQLRHSASLLVGTCVGMLLTYVAPVALLFSGNRLAACCGAAAWLLSATLFWPTVRWYRAPLWVAFCLPLIALFYMIATIESAIDYWTGKGGQWKGRVQDLR